MAAPRFPRSHSLLVGRAGTPNVSCGSLGRICYWGKHPTLNARIAPARLPRLGSSHESQKTLAEWRASQSTNVAARSGLGPNRNHGRDVARRDRPKSLLHLSESRLPGRTRRATLAGGRSPNDAVLGCKRLSGMKNRHEKKTFLAVGFHHAPGIFLKGMINRHCLAEAAFSVTAAAAANTIFALLLIAFVVSSIFERKNARGGR